MLHNAVVHLREQLRNDPFVFRRLWSMRQNIDVGHRFPRRGDHLLIEGFPRSANSFAREAFISAQPRPVRVVSHFHSSAMFALAERHAVPALLVIREPISACAALMIYADRETATSALIRYIAFHEPLIRRRRPLALAPFEEATRDFGQIIERLNTRFGTQYDAFVHTAEAVEIVMAEIVRKRDAKYARLKRRGSVGRFHIPGPHSMKEAAKSEARDALLAPSLDRLRRRAGSLHQAVLEAYAP